MPRPSAVEYDVGWLEVAVYRSTEFR